MNFIVLQARGIVLLTTGAAYATAAKVTAMGYIWALGACFVCHQVFSFNPELVPSIRINAQGQFDSNGSREPICAACVRAVNPRRIANGLEPIQPLRGAYEPEESE